MAPPPTSALGGGGRPRSANLTHEQKRLICLYARQHPRETQAQLAQWAKGRFQLDHVPSQATISIMLKRRQQFELMAGEELANKKMRTVKHPEVDMALANWFLHCQARQPRVPGELIRAKARVFFDLMAGNLPLSAAKDPPQFSNGWMHSFMNRHGFSRASRKPKASSDSAGLPGTEPSPPLPDIGSQSDMHSALEGIAHSDVFWLHEARLLCEFSPERQAETAGSCHKRLSMLLCVNSDSGDRINPLLVGQEPLNVADLPQETAKTAQYAWNRRAWPAPLLIRDWLLALDWKMRVADRQIVVVVDSVAVTAMRNMSLTNVTLRFVSPATRSSLMEPLEARIVGTLKRWYRYSYLHHVLDQREAGHPDEYAYDVGIAKVIEWIADGWQQVPRGCIGLGFAQAGMVANPAILSSQEVVEAATRAEQTMNAQIQTLLNRLKLCDAVSLDEFTFPRAEVVVEEELGDEDFADSGLHATHGSGAVIDLTGVEEAAHRLEDSESAQLSTPARTPVADGSSTAADNAALPETELLVWTESHHQQQAPVDDVQALQRVLQLARDMGCNPTVTLELNRMLRERSGANSARGSRSDADLSSSSRPVCRYIRRASTCREV